MQHEKLLLYNRINAQQNNSGTSVKMLNRLENNEGYSKSVLNTKHVLPSAPAELFFFCKVVFLPTCKVNRFLVTNAGQDSKTDVN